MTNRNVKTRLIGLSSLGIVGVLLAAAFGSEAQIARETFLVTAERFGIFAAIATAATAISMAGLAYMVYYAITTLQSVIDDNTIVLSRFAGALKKRPCLAEDSDVAAIIDGEESTLTERVIKRRAARQARKQSDA